MVYFHSLIAPQSSAVASRRWQTDAARQVRRWNCANMQISKTPQTLIGYPRETLLASDSRRRDAKPSRLYNEGESLVHQWNSKEREILGERLKAFPTVSAIQGRDSFARKTNIKKNQNEVYYWNRRVSNLRDLHIELLLKSLFNKCVLQCDQWRQDNFDRKTRKELTKLLCCTSRWFFQGMERIHIFNLHLSAYILL